MAVLIVSQDSVLFLSGLLRADVAVVAPARQPVVVDLQTSVALVRGRSTHRPIDGGTARSLGKGEELERDAVGVAEERPLP